MRLMATIVSVAALAVPSAALAYPDPGSQAASTDDSQALAQEYGMGVAKAEEAKTAGYVRAMPDDDALAESNASGSSVVLVSNSPVPDGLQAKTLIEQYGAAGEATGEATGEAVSGR